MADLQELVDLLLYTNESPSFEYKGWLDLKDKAHKAVLAKAAMALSNSGGGTIIVGMGGGDDLQSIARPSEIARYSPDDVNAAIHMFADPRLHYGLRFAIHPTTGVEHAIISAPPSPIPVMCTKHVEGVLGQHKCYVRKAGPKSEEANTAEEWRGLINRCVQEGRESMLNSIRSIFHGQVLSPDSAPKTVRLNLFAEEAFSRWSNLAATAPAGDDRRLPHGHYQLAFEIVDVPVVSLVEMRNKMREADTPNYSGWGPFVDIGRPPIGPTPVNGRIEAWLGHDDDGHFGGRDADFWLADPAGLLFSLRGFDDDFDGETTVGTKLTATLPVTRVGEALLYVSRLAKTLGDDPLIRVRMKYTGLAGRTLESSRNYRVQRRKCHSETVESEVQATASQISDTTAEVLYPLLQPLYESFEFATISIEVIASILENFKSNR